MLRAQTYIEFMLQSYYFSKKNIIFQSWNYLVHKIQLDQLCYISILIDSKYLRKGFCNILR